MLTAAEKKKLNRLKSKLVLPEDVVTSCIFGDMQHLPANVILTIFNQLTKNKIKDAKVIEILSSNIPDKVDFDFWPRWENNIMYVEPDLVVHFYKDNQRILNVIIEIKWGAELSPSCELIRQWTKRPKKNEQWMHIYLVSKEERGKEECKDSIELLLKGCAASEYPCCSQKKPKFDQPSSPIPLVSEWKDCLAAIGWRHFQKVAQDVSLKEYPEITKRWAKGVQYFLEHEGYIPFVGFASLLSKDEENIGLITPDYDVFFRPWFGSLDVISSSCEFSEMVFFDERVT